MAKVSIKNKRRFRVQISISQALWERYNDNLKLAQELGAEIEFSRDFEIWFNRQNEQVTQELTAMRESAAVDNKNPAATGGTKNHGDD